MAKRSKAYKDMMKKNKRKIMSDAREAAKYPWDYGFGLELFVDYLKYMKDYYELGENVWAIDVDGHPSRLNILNMILAAYKDWQECEDKYFNNAYATKMNNEAFVKEYNYNRKHFFELLGEHIEELWD